MSNSSASLKNHSKKLNSRDREKHRSVESGGSSQCDTPPLTEKLFMDTGSSQGKFAGIGVDSVQCAAEQVGSDINIEGAANLAEDVSYKLRQVICTIALHSGLMKKSRIDTWDVNNVLTLSDTSPVVGASAAPYVSIGDDKHCCQYENLINISDVSLTPQSYVYSTSPTVSVEWITDDASLGAATTTPHISAALHNYYTRVARAILSLKKKLKDAAVEDLATNTRIGPIFPNLFNLAVLVLNEDNLNALNVPAKKPLQSNVLDMVDALCSNPCCLDTNIQQQFQRLFPVMVSNILGNGSLADKMVAILTKITRTWPSFIAIGKGIVLDYLAQGSKERLTAPMIKCVAALGREALVQCLGEHLHHIDELINLRTVTPRTPLHAGPREAVLDASTRLLRSEPTTFLEDYVITDYTLYEMLGDSVLPRRTIYPYTASPNKESSESERNSEEEFVFLPMRGTMRRSKVKVLPQSDRCSVRVPRDAVFIPTKYSGKRYSVQVIVKSFRTKDIPVRINKKLSDYNVDSEVRLVGRSGCGVTVACGLLNRFRYRLRKPSAFPIYGAMIL